MRSVLFFLVIIACATPSMAQRKVSELMLSYDLAIISKDGPATASATQATMTIYIKGPMSRSDLVYPSFTTSTIHNARTGAVVLLQEVSGQKLIRKLTPENWLVKNAKYRGISFVPAVEKRTIAGYPCQKAEAKLTDGTSFEVYYTRELIPENKEYDFMFRELDGLPLEWEVLQGKNRIRFSLNKITMNPIPASRFDIPSTGYRELPYQE